MSKQINVRCSDEVAEKIKAMADERNLALPALLEQLVDESSARAKKRVDDLKAIRTILEKPTNETTLVKMIGAVVRSVIKNMKARGEL